MLDALVEAHPGAVPRFTKGAEAEKAWRAVVPVHEKDRNPHVRYMRPLLALIVNLGSGIYLRRPGRYWPEGGEVTRGCMIHWQRAIHRLLLPAQQPAKDRDSQAVQRDPSEPTEAYPWHCMRARRL
jgi:hypothetical protein